MRLTHTLVVFATLSFAAALAGLLMVVTADEVHWGYDGAEGPASWGELSPEYALCAEGKAQSPIDIRDAAMLDLIDIEFHYGEAVRDLEARHSIYNNSHTIQVNIAEGSYIIYNGITYDLLQFHFHAPSEHTISGEAAPMEVHFVHLDRNSANLAVVGVLLTEGDEDNEAFAAVFNDLPNEVGEPDAMREPLNLQSLLPDARTYFTYQGSLTTPPCSEIVRWLLLDTPVELSAAQIGAFRVIYNGNARPVQPRGDRDLLLKSR